jgi:ABC-type branched-subunit amino acid transport system substrate-binding protein
MLPTRGYEDLAHRVAAQQPQAILLAGCVCENGPRLVVDLRRALGADPHLLAPDVFWSFGSELQRIRRAAEGLYISVAGPSPERLTARGRSLLLDGRAADEIDPYEITAAQAAEVLLEAIGPSDRTRAGVTAALIGTASRNGIAGPVRFDSNGDLVDAPVLIYRMQFGASRTRVPGIGLPDVVLDRTLYPPRLPAP